MSSANKYIITSNFGHDFIEEHATSDYRYKCPKCEAAGRTADDYKLYVSYKNLVFHCFRCDWKGKLESETLVEEGSTNTFIKALSKYTQEVQSVEDPVDTVYKIPTTIPSETDPATKYLETRGVSYEDVLRFNMRVATANDPYKFYGRVVIPNRLIAGNWTDMYSARSYTGAEPKYLNPKNSPRAKTVFNLHNIPQNCEQIIINEGVLTSIVAGYDSVATYGKSVTDEQISLILAKNPKRIYVSLDNDTNIAKGLMKDPTRYKIDKLIKQLLTNTSAEIYLVKMPPGKDAVDLGRDAYRNLLTTSSVRIRNISEYQIYSLNY